MDLKTAKTAKTVKTVWQDSLKEAQEILSALIKDQNFMGQCEKLSELLIQTWRGGNRVFTCGNGGSHCDAMHFAEEMTGRYRKDRKPLGALALGDPSHVTCVANDYGFEYVFSRQIEALGNASDVLMGFSTSGNSQNILNAFETAKEKGIKTVGVLGRDGGQLKDISDLAIIVPSQTSDRIQEVHIKIIHTVIETVERTLFPENY